MPQQRETDKVDEQVQQNRREVVEKAYGAVLGSQFQQGLLAFSLEQAVAEQLQRIDGDGTALRPTEKQRVQKVAGDMRQLLTQLSEDEQQAKRKPRNNVNTPRE